MRKLIFASLAAAALVGAATPSGAGQPVADDRYGHWDPTWGSIPPPPLESWDRWKGHESGWYGHVHSCMAHRRYDPRRDAYWAHHRWVPCAD